MRWPTSLVLLAAMVLASCRDPGYIELVDTLGSSMDQTHIQFDPDLRIQAPFIVGASVIENTIVSHHQPAARIPSVLLDLHRVRCNREVLIRGKVGEQFTFYYFDQSPESQDNNDYYKVPFRADAGSHYVFFLMPEREYLRSIGDVGDYSLKIRSGAHPTFEGPYDPGWPDGPAPSRTIGIAIANLLLTLGENPNLKGLAQDLSSQSQLLDRWGSRLHNFALIRELISAPEPVRSAACRVLSQYYGDSECRASGDDPDTKLARDKARLIRFQNSNGLEFQGGRIPETRRGLLEELQIQLYSPYTPLAEASCVAIKHYFPDETCEKK